METNPAFTKSGQAGCSLFGKRLSSVRLHLQFSPGKLAEKIGCYPVLIQAIEEGTIVKSDVLLGVVIKLQTEFGILIEYFLLDCGSQSYTDYSKLVTRKKYEEAARQKIVDRLLKELNKE